MPEDESRALLQELWAHCTRAEFQYRHRWRVGDLVMWDNIPTQHLAICDYALPQRRLMHRTTLRESIPFGDREEKKMQQAKQIGRAHEGTPVTKANTVCRILL